MRIKFRGPPGTHDIELLNKLYYFFLIEFKILKMIKIWIHPFLINLCTKVKAIELNLKNIKILIFY